MKRAITFFLLLQTIPYFAQNNCQAGYSEREVKCNGQITTRCVPDNYTCNKCWTVQFAPCPGHINGGQSDYSSYDAAASAAKRESNNWHDGVCTFYDNKNYTIYLDDSKLCGSNSGSSSKAGSVKFNSKLYSDIMKSIQDLRDKLAQLRQAYDNFPLVARAGPGLVGYLDFVRRAQNAADFAGQKAQEYQREPMQQLEEALRSTNQDLNNYYFQASEKIVYMQTETMKQNEQKRVNDTEKQRQIAEKQHIEKQQALQNAQDQIARQQQQNAENFKRSSEQLGTAIGDLGNAILQAQQNKANQEARQRQEEENRQKQRELDRLKQQQEIENQNYLAEQKRLAEKSNVENWQNKSNDVLNNTADRYRKMKSLSDLENTKINSVFYIVWNFTKYNGITISKPIEIKKSADGDWILNSDLKKQLVSKTKLTLSTTPDGTAIKDNELYYLVGYMESANEANAVFNQIKQNANARGYTITELNVQMENTTNSTKSLWEE